MFRNTTIVLIHHSHKLLNLQVSSGKVPHIGNDCNFTSLRFINRPSIRRHIVLGTQIIVKYLTKERRKHIVTCISDYIRGLDW
jgi:hypothetical protein